MKEELIMKNEEAAALTEIYSPAELDEIAEELRIQRGEIAGHTPGPWQADKWAPGWTVSAPDSHYSVCHLEGCNNDQSNARLIASAPTLLDELDKRAGNLETMADYLELWLKHGATKPAGADTPTGQTMVDALRICAFNARTAIAKAKGEL